VQGRKTLVFVRCASSIFSYRPHSEILATPLHLHENTTRVIYLHKLGESIAPYDCWHDPRRFFTSDKSFLISFTSLAVSSNSHDSPSSTVGWASTTNDNINSTPITRNTLGLSALDMVAESIETSLSCMAVTVTRTCTLDFCCDRLKLLPLYFSSLRLVVSGLALIFQTSRAE